MSKSKQRSPGRSIVSLVGIALLVAAIARELSRPAEERTWEGKVAGVVPYDFRVPTMDRLQERMWAPENPQLLTPQVFGVGWGVNVGRLMAMLQSSREKLE
jgi:Family of unknown function (DUF5808)